MTLVSSLWVGLTGSLRNYDDDGSASVIKIDGLTFFLFVTGVGEFQDTTFKITNLRKKFVSVRLRPP